MTTDFPPADFVATKSAIAGIEIYKPAAQDKPEHREIVAFKCPQCDASTAYNAIDGGLTCSFCGYHEAPEVPVVGKGAEEFEFTVDAVNQASHGWGVDRKELQCQRCGAHTSLPADSLTHTCPFCDSNNVIQHKAPQDILRPRFLVPFKLEAEACVKIAREWLSSSWMTPGQLRRLAHLDEFVPVYLPFWTFDATILAGWRAEVGHTKTERSYDSRSKSWRTTTRTVWRWESGQVHQVVDDLIVTGTTRLSQIILGRVNQFNLAELVAYDPKYLAGQQAQAYDLTLEPAWEQARSQMRENTRLACRQQASTSKIRNFSMSLDFSEESWRYVLLPVYVAAYSYQSKPYQVMVNGQTGVIAGQRPADWLKIWLVFALLLSPGLLLSCLGLATLALGGAGFLIAAFGFMVLAAGLVGGFTIVRKAQELDDA